MTTEEEVRRGQEAENLMNNALLVEILENIKDDCLEAALDTPATDDLTRFRLLEGINVVRKIAQELGVAAKNGQISAHFMESMKGEVRTH